MLWGGCAHGEGVGEHLIAGEDVGVQQHGGLWVRGESTARMVGRREGQGGGDLSKRRGL